MDALILGLMMPALVSVPDSGNDPHAECTKTLHADVTNLVCLLQGGDPGERRTAAYQLGKLEADCPRIVSMLAAALKDKESSVRSAAVKALGRIGKAARPAVPALMESLKTGRVCPCTVDAALKRIQPACKREQQVKANTSGRK